MIRLLPLKIKISNNGPSLSVSVLVWVSFLSQHKGQIYTLWLRNALSSFQMVLQEKAEALMEEAEEIITIPSDMPVGREVEISESQQFSEELSVSFSQL